MRSVMWKVMCAAVLLTACDESGIEPVAFEGEDAAVTVPSDGDAGSDAATNPRGDADVNSDATTPAEDAAVVQDSATPQSDASTSTSDAGTSAHDAGTSSNDAGTSADAGQITPCTTVYYRDMDGDGFGNPAMALTSCSMPDGYVANASDCYDQNKIARPGQTGRSAVHRGDGSFDYDCDGVQRLQIDKVASLPVFNGSECPIPRAQLPGEECDYQTQARAWGELMDGWYMTVADCGVQAAYGPGYTLTWSDETRTFGYKPTGLVGHSTGSRIQSCN